MTQLIVNHHKILIQGIVLGRVKSWIEYSWDRQRPSFLRDSFARYFGRQYNLELKLVFLVEYELNLL